MIAFIATLTIGFILAAAVIFALEPLVCAGQKRQEKRTERGSRLRVLKKLTVHLKGREKGKKSNNVSAPPAEWKKQPLNKLELYKNYIIKKAEITPIR